MRPQTWFDPVYDVTFSLVRCRYQELDRWVLRHFGPGYTPMTARQLARTVIGPYSQEIAFWFPLGKVPPSTVAHEAVHAGCNVLRDRGVKLKEASEEALAYYVGYLVREITRRLR
jgi:hypothetical protein